MDFPVFSSILSIFLPIFFNLLIMNILHYLSANSSIWMIYTYAIVYFFSWFMLYFLVSV